MHKSHYRNSTVPRPLLILYKTKTGLMLVVFCLHNTQYTSKPDAIQQPEENQGGGSLFRSKPRNNYVYPLILDTLFNYPSISVGFPTEVDFTYVQFRNNYAHFMRNGIARNSVQYNILNSKVFKNALLEIAALP